MDEIWKDIPSYDGKYQVSNTGKVRSQYNRKHGNLLHPDICRGYERVVLVNRKHGKKHAFVHRLVAEAFVANPNNYAIINHKDEDKLNNHAENLEWCTHQYNSTYGTATMRYGISRGQMVQQLTNDKHPIPIAIYYSISIAAKINGLHGTAISKCCMGKLNSTGGYKWRYIE